MDTYEFLESVWPKESEGNGFYCIVTLPHRKHHVFDTIAEAADTAELARGKSDVYFAIHTLDQPFTVGEDGKKHYRTHANMKKSRAFFADLDVGADKPYTTQDEALAGLDHWLAATQFPRPTIVNSGYGIHVYWTLITPMTSLDWLGYAKKLHVLFQEFELHVDPSRVSDRSSILRVPNTFNHKNGGSAPVAVWEENYPTKTSEMLDRIDGLTIVTGNPVGIPIGGVPLHMSSQSPLTNIQDGFDYDGYSPTVKEIGKICPLFQEFVKNPTTISQDEWYFGVLENVRLAEDGHKWAHDLSAMDPARYDPAVVDDKLTILAEKRLLGTTCTKMASIAKPERAHICKSCKYLALGKGPWGLAASRSPAPPPPQKLNLNSTAPVNPQHYVDPPDNYTRLAAGGLAFTPPVSKNGAPGVPIRFYDHDLYPVDMVVNNVSRNHDVVWHLSLHRAHGIEEYQFAIPLADHYIDIKLIAHLSMAGVVVDKEHLNRMGNYMVAYISKLQKAIQNSQQFDHFGWEKDFTAFILNGEMITAEGAKPISLNTHAKNVGADLGRAGTLQKQIDLLKFYAHDEFIPAQFMVLSSLSSVLLHMTNEAGLIINATGDPGASKSTSTFAAASLWAHPTKYPVNGTGTGITVNARQGRSEVLANLPGMLDEVTLMQGPELREFSMSASQVRPGRIRLDRNGVQRPASTHDQSGLMLTNSNNSLHQTLAEKNQGGSAGSMRVFEIRYTRSERYSRPDGEAFLAELKENFGHLGPAFVLYVILNYNNVKQRVLAKNRELDTLLEITQGERFWGVLAAVNIVTAEICEEQGWLFYPADRILNWLVNDQFPKMRSVIKTSYRGSLDVLMDYITSITSQILVVRGQYQTTTIVKDFHNGMEARYELDTKVMYVQRQSFRSYCTREGFNYRSIIEELTAKGILAGESRRSLGAYTPGYDTGQTWTVVVNMSHPDIAGAAPIANLPNARVIPFGKTNPNLGVVADDEEDEAV